jgi:hypothetical protein
VSKRDLFMPDARCLRGPGWTDAWTEGRDGTYSVAQEDDMRVLRERFVGYPIR